MCLFIFACGARTGLDADRGDSSVDGFVPIQDAGNDLNTEAQVSLDEASICFLRNGQLRCWGWNLFGTLGDGTFTDRYTPQVVPGLSWVNEVAGDEGHVCARLDDGSVRCWGDNSGGELGIGYISAADGGDAASLSVPTPTTVLAVTGAVALTNRGSGNASCVKTRDNRFICWGPNGFGELPGLTLANHSTPMEVVALSGAKKVAMGVDFTCALFADGAVKCSGRNKFGELGDGTTSGRGTLAPVLGVTQAIDIACRQGAAYALLANHTVVWWGVAVGNTGQIAEQHLTPIPLPLSNVVQIAAAGIHACARLLDGSVECGGLNDRGQLGDGTTNSRGAMAQVFGISDAVDIAAGVFNSCAIVKSGGLYCWGGNQYGQIGNGHSGGPQTVPVLVSGL